LFHSRAVRCDWRPKAQLHSHPTRSFSSCDHAGELHPPSSIQYARNHPLAPHFQSIRHGKLEQANESPVTRAYRPPFAYDNQTSPGATFTPPSILTFAAGRLMRGGQQSSCLCGPPSPPARQVTDLGPYLPLSIPIIHTDLLIIHKPRYGSHSALQPHQPLGRESFFSLPP